jgi:peptidylprolyl isomerase
LAQQHLKDILLLRKANDRRGLEQMEEQLDAQAKAMVANLTDFHFTAEQMEAYTTVGGTPHLDAEYTVFGEVVSGMEIVEKIQEMPTDRNDRPLADVKILKLTAVDED